MSPVLRASTISILFVSFLVCSVLPTSTTATALPPVPFSTQNLKHFIQNKCENPLTNNAAIWSYEGRLVDPTNGNIIANVEGIELVRSLTEITRPDLSEKKNVWKLVRGLRRLNDLKVRSILSGPGWDYSATLLSRKLFCYSPIDAPNTLMKEYRLHPTAPSRKVKADQAVALYDTATSFISMNGGTDMVVMTEWPDGHWIQSEASANRVDNEDLLSGDSSHNMDFTVYARKSGKRDVPMLPDKKNESKDGKPSRTNFIQFGKDDNSEDQRYGARETYSFNMGNSELTRSEKVKTMLKVAVEKIKDRVGLWDLDEDILPSWLTPTSDPTNSCTVRYTRYGEAPSWYGPGKMCTLELWGKRVDSLAELPPMAATLAATRIPGFMSVHSSIPSGKVEGQSSSDNPGKEVLAADEAAIKAVNWFRGKGGALPLEVVTDGEKEETLAETIVNTGLSIAQKIRAATVVKSASEL